MTLKLIGKSKFVNGGIGLELHGVLRNENIAIKFEF